MNEIKINKVSNGIRVNIGCISLVYQQDQINQFIADLKKYLKEPHETEKELRKRWKIKGESDGETFGLGDFFTAPFTSIE